MISGKHIIFLVAVVFTHGVMAQNGESIKATVSKQTLLLGEPLVLRIETYRPAGSAIQFEQPDSIPHFEFLKEPVTDSVVSADGTRYSATYTITSFDSGHWVIPSFALAKGIQTDTIPIDVVFSDFDPEQDYHDIKDVLEVKLPRERIPWWIYAAVLFIGLMIMILVRRKKKPVVVPAAPSRDISPYEEAMDALEQLQHHTGETKEYYSKLVNIFRLYMFRKKGILSLQKTTDDLVVQLKQLQLDKDSFDQLAQALRLSDFVKFAKYIPAAADQADCAAVIKKSIITIEKSNPQTPSGGEG